VISQTCSDATLRWTEGGRRHERVIELSTLRQLLACGQLTREEPT
jgi:hypothetical protein